MRTLKQYQTGARLRNFGLNVVFLLHGLLIIGTAIGLMVYFIIYQEGVKKSILACNANAEVGFIAVLSFIFVLILLVVVVVLYFSSIGAAFNSWLEDKKIPIQKEYVYGPYERGFFNWCLRKGYLAFGTYGDTITHYKKLPAEQYNDMYTYDLDYGYNYSKDPYLFKVLKTAIEEAWLYHKDEFEHELLNVSDEQSTTESSD